MYDYESVPTCSLVLYLLIHALVVNLIEVQFLSKKCKF